MEKYSLFICVEMVAKMATNKYESLRRLFLLYPLYPHILKMSGYNGYNECKEPDILSEMQRKNIGNLTEIHC